MTPKSTEPRLRLIGGLFAALEDKGYAAITIADVVRRAGVSKRTFYEHFADKEACFLAAYVLVSQRMLRLVGDAVDVTRPWDEQVEAAVNAYVDGLGATPALSRIFMLEVHAAGTEAVQLQRETHAAFAKLLRRLVAQGRSQNPELGPLGPSMATAIVGGINELALGALQSDVRKLRKIGPTIMELVGAVLTARE